MTACLAGFAIPVDTLKVIVQTLIRFGKVTRPAIGITYLETSQARALGIERGVLVLDVPQGSPADQAGMRGTSRSSFGSIELGDIILDIDGSPIANEADLFKILENHQPGDRIQITVARSERAPNEDGATGKPSATARVTLQVTLKAATSAERD